MLTPSWQLTDPINAIIFDCDGTLSKIEGIDELATSNNTSHIVQELTQEAMGKTGMNVGIYNKRLELVNPTQERILALGENYIKNHSPDAKEVISIFKSLNKPVYIISAGIFQAVATFAKWLDIDESHVYAVNVVFDNNGHYVGFDEQSPLVARNGKQIFVNNLSQGLPRLGYIGDGLNDYEVYPLVTRFIGYGGAYYRQNIADLCEFYVKNASLASILPLLLTQDEYHILTPDHQALYNKGMANIFDNQVQIK
jgi:phosphoserine phosphatase